MSATHFSGPVESPGGFTQNGAKVSLNSVNVAALTAVASANATDLPTTLTLVNEIKTKLNAVIAALQS